MFGDGSGVHVVNNVNA